jgi:hypothetical protein
VKGLQDGLDRYNMVPTWNLKAMPGTSTLYFVSQSSSPYQSKFGTVDASENLQVSATPITGKVYDFDFAGGALYYLTPTHIGKPDGSLIPIPSEWAAGSLVVVGRYAYFRTAWNNLYRADLDTGALTEFAGKKGGREFRNGVGAEAQFASIQNLAYNPVANALFVVDSTRIRKVTLAGEVSDFVGQTGSQGLLPVDGKGSNATLSTVANLTSDDAGNLFFNEYAYGTLRMVSPDGEVTTIAGKPRTTRLMTDGVGETASFANAMAITFGQFNGKPALFVGDNDDNTYQVRLVTNW